MPTVLLVGSREAATEAACGLGCQVYLLAERKPLRRQQSKLAGFRVFSFDMPAAEAFATARELLGAAIPDAIVAVTERAVAIAARLRETLGVKGHRRAVAHRCRDKSAMRVHARKYGIPCTDHVKLNARTTGAQLVKRLGLPLVLKPAAASGARGSKIVREMSELHELPGSGYIAESFVHGLEMSIESFVHEGRILLTNVTEYLLPLWANIVPATWLAPSVLHQVKQLNTKVIHAFGIERGVTHVELFLTTGGPVFGEIAIRPPGGQIMALIQRSYDFDPWQTAILLELGRRPQLPKKARRHSGVCFFHPGAGCVQRVHGLRSVKTLPGVVNVTCKVAAGEQLRPRGGSGESVAHVIAVGAERADVAGALRQAGRTLVIELAAPDARELQAEAR
jgi:biotin carboxylase